MRIELERYSRLESDRNWMEKENIYTEKYVVIASIRFDRIGILFHANLPFSVTLLQMVARKLVSDDHVTLYARMLQVYLAKRFVWAANWCHGKQKCTQTYLILTVCAVLVIGPKWCGAEEKWSCTSSGYIQFESYHLFTLKCKVSWTYSCFDGILRTHVNGHTK